MILNLDFVSLVPGYQKKNNSAKFLSLHISSIVLVICGEVVQFLEEPLSLGRTIKKKSKQSTGG